MFNIAIVYQNSGLYEYLEFLFHQQAPELTVKPHKGGVDSNMQGDLLIIEADDNIKKTAALLKKARLSLPDVPIILLHPSRLKITLEQALDLGADDLMPRLGDADKLFEKVYYHLTIKTLLKNSFSRRVWVSESFGGINGTRYSTNALATLRKRGYFTSSLQHDSLLGNDLKLSH